MEQGRLQFRLAEDSAFLADYADRAFAPGVVLFLQPSLLAVGETGCGLAPQGAAGSLADEGFSGALESLGRRTLFKDRGTRVPGRRRDIVLSSALSFAGEIRGDAGGRR